MSWGAVAGAAIGVVGGAMSNKGGSSSSSKQEIDPRFAPYLYGSEDGSMKGLLSDSYDWYSQNKTGLNDQMRQGLNSQWAVMADPNTMGGYQQMANLGSGLMGAPVAGNPFTDGRASLMSGGASNLGMGGGQQTQVAAPQFPSFQRPQSPVGSMTPAPGPFTAPPPAPAVAAPPPAAPAVPTGMPTWDEVTNAGINPTRASDGGLGMVWDNHAGRWIHAGYGGNGA